MRQFLRLTDGHVGLYSGVYRRSGFWLEGARNSEEAELLSPRRSLLLPLEFVVPAFAIFSTLRLKRVFTSGEMAMFRLSKLVVLGLAMWMLAAPEAKAGTGFQ